MGSSDSAFWTSIATVLVAFITGVVSLVTYQKGKRNDEKTEKIAKVLTDTGTPVESLVELVQALQDESKESRKKYERKIKSLEDEVDELRDDKSYLTQEVERLRKIIRQHERRLNDGGINGESRDV